MQVVVSVVEEVRHSFVDQVRGGSSSFPFAIYLGAARKDRQLVVQHAFRAN